MTLNSPLYLSAEQVAKVELLAGVGIENIHIKAISGNLITQKVYFKRCVNSWIKGSELTGACNDGYLAGQPTEIYILRL